ncbi:MAG: response regulator [Clostridia bacterium]|nr:response regulator [Clostridia bacterium]
MKLKDYTNAINPIYGVLIIVIISMVFFYISAINNELDHEIEMIEEFSEHLQVDFDQMNLCYQELLNVIQAKEAFNEVFMNYEEDNLDLNLFENQEWAKDFLEYNPEIMDVILKNIDENRIISLVSNERIEENKFPSSYNKWLENELGYYRFGFSEESDIYVFEIPILYEGKNTRYVLSFLIDLNRVFYSTVNENYRIDIFDHEGNSYFQNNNVIHKMYDTYGSGLFDLPSPFNRDKDAIHLSDLPYYDKHVISSHNLNEYYTLVVIKAYNRYNLSSSFKYMLDHFIAIGILILSMVSLMVYSNQRTKLWIDNDKQFLNEVIEMDKINLSEVKSELKFYTDFFMEATIPLIVVDKETLRIVKVNTEATKFYGYQEQEMLSFYLTDVCKWEDDQSENMLVNVQHITKDKHVLERYVRVQDVLFNDDEMLILLVIGNSPMESSKIEAMKVEMFHEIRSPLQGAYGAIEKIEKATNGFGDYIGIIKRSLNSVLNMTNNVLAENKNNQRKHKLFLSEFDLIPLIDEVVSLSVYQDLHYNIIASNINIIKENTLVPIQHYFMKSDSVKVRQILVNLMSNAVKYTQNGMINLTVEILEKEQKDVIVFRVSDTGVGLTKEQIDHLYDAYETFGDPGSDVVQTGLGMTITKKYVEMLGSELHVSSEYGIGSTFSFSLEVSKSRENALSDNKYSILIVDDDEVSLEFLEQLLKKEKSYFVRTLHLETDMLSEMNRHNYDLVIMDENLNHFKGSDLKSLIRQSINKRIAEIPILMMTATPKDTIEVDYQTKWIQKPFDEIELYDAIHLLIEQNSVQTDLNIDPSIISYKKLYDTIEGVGFEVFFELVEKFKHNSLEEIAAIKQLLAVDNYDQVQILLHRLKGSMSYFAPVTALQLVMSMEQMAKIKDDNLIYEISILEKSLHQLHLTLEYIVEKNKDL